MQLLPELFDKLTDSLRMLPGVGPRSAQRMALSLLQTDRREQATNMAQTILQAITTISHCQQCRNYADQPLCPLCQDGGRNRNQICIVESPADLIAIESSGTYHGLYFVLMGKLSPLDGVGPRELGIDQLTSRVDEVGPEEVILALSATVEGEATSHYLSDLLEKKIEKISRIAQGIPTGGNLEYLDTRTLIHAFDDRKRVS